MFRRRPLIPKPLPLPLPPPESGMDSPPPAPIQTAQEADSSEIPAWKVFIGLALVVAGLGFGIFIWERALSKIVDMHDIRVRELQTERRVSTIEERLASIDQHVAGIAKALGVSLSPAP